MFIDVIYHLSSTEASKSVLDFMLQSNMTSLDIIIMNEKSEVVSDSKKY